MQKWRNRQRRKPKKSPAEDAAPQLPPLQPAYPGMNDDVPPQRAAAPEPVETEVQPEEVAEKPPEAPAPKPRRRRTRAKQPAAAAPTPPTSLVEPGSATGEAAEVALPELPPEMPEEAVAVEEPETEAPAPSAHPAPATATKSGKKIKGAVVLAIGLPGSGKSTWFKRHGVVPLSSDLMRHLLFDNVQEQRFQDLVFSTLRSLLRARMIARMPWNYVDATNLSPKERRHWIKMAQDFGYEAHAVYFEVPLEVCMERNAKRNRIVPAEIMQRMAAKLRAPGFDEGFSKITVVRVREKTA
jgi:predicted kinase